MNVLLLAGLIANLWDTFNHSAYIHQSYIHPTENSMYNEEFRGFEIGALCSTSFNDHVTFRSHLKYEPYFNDGYPLEFEFATLDFYSSYRDQDFGILVGKQTLPLGFFGDTRSMPAGRQSIVPLMSSTHPTMRDVMGGGYGGYAYLQGLIGHVAYEVGGGKLRFDDPQPDREYSFVWDYKSERFEWEYYHLELSYQGIRLQVDALDSRERCTFGDSAYLGPYGGTSFTHYRPIYVYGVQLWLHDFSFTFEYMDADGAKITPDATEKLFHNVGYTLEEISYGAVVQYHQGIHWKHHVSMSKNYIEASPGMPEEKRDLYSRGQEYHVGSEYSTGNWIFRAEFVHVNNARHISFDTNRDRADIKKLWNIYALSVTYTLEDIW